MLGIHGGGGEVAAQQGSGSFPAEGEHSGAGRAAQPARGEGGHPGGGGEKSTCRPFIIMHDTEHRFFPQPHKTNVLRHCTTSGRDLTNALACLFKVWISHSSPSPACGIFPA